MSGFLDFLEWMGRPQQAVVNALAGRPGSALKHSAQFGLDIVDSVLPFDLIPDITGPEDKLSGSDLLGLSPDAHWSARLAADLGVGIVTDPLTYLTGGASAAAKAGKGIAAAKALGEARGLATGSTAALKAARSVPGASDLAMGAMRTGVVGDVEEIANATLATIVRDAQKLKRPVNPTGMDAFMGAGQPQNIHPLAAEALALQEAKAAARAQVRSAEQTIDKLRAFDGTDASRMANITPDPIIDVTGRGLAKGMSSDAFVRAEEALTAAKADLDAATGAVNLFTRGVKKGVRKEAAATAGYLEAADQLPGILERDISRSGRRALAKEGRTAEEIISGVINKLNGDLSEESIRSALSTPALAPYFEQGGIRFMGKQIVAEEPLRQALANTLGPATAMIPEGLRKQGASTYRAVANGFSRIMGWDTVSPEISHAVKFGPATVGAQVAQAQAKHLESVFSKAGVKAGSAEDKAIADVFDNLFYDGDKVVGLIDPTDTMPLAERINLSQARAAEQAMVQGVADTTNWAAVNSVAQDLIANSQQQWDELIRMGVIDATHGEAIPNYLRRSFIDETPLDMASIRESVGGPNSLKGRSLDTPEKLLAAVTGDSPLKLDRSAAGRSLDRSMQQGKSIAQHEAAKALLGRAMPGLNAETTRQITEVAQALGASDPAAARWINDLFAGRAPRGPVLATLAKANRVFKPAAVYGFLVPRFAAITRNEMGGIVQAYSGIGRDAALAEAKRAPQQLWGAIANGFAKALGKEPVFGNELAQMLRTYDDTLREVTARTGDFREVRAALQSKNPLLVEALDAGVFDGFVHSEDLLRKMAAVPSVMQRWMDMPGEMFQGVEVGLRLGAFKDLRQGGVSAKKASEFVRDAFLDYSIPNTANRTLRDLVPFASFTAQTLRQQGRLFSQRPGFLAATGHLYSPDSDTSGIPEWIAGQAHVKLGKDEEGNQLYSTGFGLPQEALDFIPNLSGDIREMGVDLRTGVLGSAHPLLKTAFSVVSGRDPYFDSPVLSYARTPAVVQALGAPEDSEFGRGYQFTRSTGLIQPVSSLVDLASKALDSRKSAGARATNLLTGASIVSVDEERTRISNLARQLEMDPTVRSMQIFYSKEENDLLEQYKIAQAAKRRSSDQR